MLITPTAWAQKHFCEESRPDEVKIRRWLRDGAVPGRKVGGTWFVDETEWLANGDPLVQKVLEAS